MGVVNVTPDSFSDGGQWFGADQAIARGIALAEAGASIIDVGGESTRPGALPISREEEKRRVVPVVRELAAGGLLVSVDTMWAETAEAAVEAGAGLINDVSGGRADPQMLPLAARLDLPFVVMHWRGHSAHMQQHTSYDDVVSDVLTELQQQVQVAVAAGVRDEHIILDPGIGFSKTTEQNWHILAALDRFVALGRPLLVAASRKRFLGELLADAGELRPADQRDDATAAISTLAAHAGAWAVRVHEPAASADAVRVVARMKEASNDHA